jgi:pilus assembly protein Flp/PilA
MLAMRNRTPAVDDAAVPGTPGRKEHDMFRFLLWLQDRVKRSEDGATAVEYGMMVALIAAVIVTVVTTLGTDVKGAFQKVVDAI